IIKSRFPKGYLLFMVGVTRLLMSLAFYETVPRTVSPKSFAHFIRRIWISLPQVQVSYNSNNKKQIPKRVSAFYGRSDKT
ncbi:MAG: hypothetical protein ACI4V4_01805, partial [Eubacterium sp.]